MWRKRQTRVVLVLGISSRLEGEEMPVYVNRVSSAAIARTSNFPKRQEALLQAVAATGKPVVVVLLSAAAPWR